jgi:hypothetical protein
MYAVRLGLLVLRGDPGIPLDEHSLPDFRQQVRGLGGPDIFVSSGPVAARSSGLAGLPSGQS